MQKKQLTDEQLADAERLKATYESKKKSLKLTMQKISDQMEISLSALGHYFYGRNALNTKAVSALAAILKVDVADLSPTLAEEIRHQSQSLQVSLSHRQLMERIPVRLKIITGEGKSDIEEMGGYLRMDNTFASAFAVQIVGTKLWPRVNTGEFLVIEPELPLQTGGDVYIHLANQKIPLINMLVRETPEGYTVMDYSSNRPVMIYKEDVLGIYPVTAIVNSARYISSM